MTKFENWILLTSGSQGIVISDKLLEFCTVACFKWLLSKLFNNRYKHIETTFYKLGFLVGGKLFNLMLFLNAVPMSTCSASKIIFLSVKVNFVKPKKRICFFQNFLIHQLLHQLSHNLFSSIKQKWHHWVPSMKMMWGRVWMLKQCV